jgi:hypothetical protein
MPTKNQPDSVGLSATLTIPELEQSKAAVLNTFASLHSLRIYEYAIERFITWYCSEPRLTFNRSVVVKYRSFLERLSLSAATINLHLSAIRRLADESAESGWLSPEHAIGIRRVKGVKRLGRKMGNWLTRNQAQELVNAASKHNLRGWRDGAMLGLLFGMWIATLGSRGFKPRPVAIERGSLGHCQFGRKRKTATNSTRTVVEQGTSRCLAPSFRSERGKSIQTGFEGGNATRSWCDSQCGLVCGEAMCLSSWHSQFGTSRPSALCRIPDNAECARYGSSLSCSSAE